MFLVVVSMSIICSSSIGIKAKTRINKKVKIIYLGDTLNLKVKSKEKRVKWSSSNKKIATVNKKGRVKGKRVGKITITAKTKNKVYKFPVTIKGYSIEEMEEKVNQYFKKSKKYNVYFVAYDTPPEQKGNVYNYYIRSTGGTQANVMVGYLEVNIKSGKGILHFDYGETVKIKLFS